MPLLDRITQKVTDQLPSVITPRTHAFLECATAAGFLLFCLSAWKRDKRVAVSSAGCGLFSLMTSAVTNFSEVANGKVPLDTHARIDLGFAAMVGTMPSFMGLEDKYDIRFFRLQAVAIAALAGLTDFSGTGERKQLRQIEKSGKTSREEALHRRAA